VSEPTPPAKARQLPATCQSINKRVTIGALKIFIIAAKFEDGSIGHIEIKIAKNGSSLHALLHAFVDAVSRCLQHGDSLESLAPKYIGTIFEPNGMTNDPDFPHATSIIDYTFRWLVKVSLGQEKLDDILKALRPPDEEA
jgi:ribonucleoside-diphosphate reductase alpha chain